MITISHREYIQKQMTNEHLSQAVNAVCKFGFVILSNVVEHDHLDAIRERMTVDSQKLISAGKWGGAGYVRGHFQQGPPPFAPYLFQDIVSNHFAIQVTHAILGDGLYNCFYSSNTNTPKSDIQPLHLDSHHLWGNLSVAHPASSLAINIPLIELNEGNGSTEIWPCSHLVPINPSHISEIHRPGYISEDLATKQRSVVPPIRANIPKGGILIRDMRMWHRGVPNNSTEIRHMIAMIHNITRCSTFYICTNPSNWRG